LDSHVFQTLEFDKVVREVANHCETYIGKEHMMKLQPSTNIDEVNHLLEEMDEALAILRVRASVPLGGITDIRPFAQRAKIGSLLDAKELLAIADTIQASVRLRHFLEQIEEDDEIAIPLFLAKKDAFPIVTPIAHDIRQAIDENGRVLDSASSALRSIRQSLRAREAKVRSRLEGYTRSRSKMLSDTLVTIRNERFVLPVKAEYRSAFGGIVHDTSASGQTLFIEPNAVVQENNDIRALKMKEREEIEKILWALTNLVQEEADALILLTEQLAAIDVIVAKAKYGTANKCTKPEVNDRGYIRLSQARHPLISIEEAVANTIEFGDEITTIVITGPNTGGKTVTLKTVGLAVLMAQSGIPIPALDGSEIAVFDHVFADIGDEQSIEQSLSTFSAHMVNIVDILKRYNDRSLLLFDELGSGTDPQEGAALAISILDEVHGTGARVMATTHYPELKAYSYNREGVVNASVEFDIDTLSPTYRLLIGVPGRSNAFEISKRLGLPDDIIERARTFTGTDSGEVNEMIASLEASRIAAEDQEAETKRLLEEAEVLRKELKEQLVQYESQEERLLEKAKEKAAKVVEKAQREAKEAMEELRFMRKYAEADIKDHELIEIQKRLEGAMPEDDWRKKQPEPKKPSRPLQEGDEVKVLDFGQRGTLMEKRDDGEWVVQVGMLKMNVKEERLELTKPVKDKAPVATSTVKRRGPAVSTELDLRGERYDAAMRRTEKYIDEALLANHGQVSIIHGKGTGALQKGVHQLLKRHPRVEEFRFGMPGEGGFGITIAKLK